MLSVSGDKKRTLYLIHHSHTDIGYTDRQEKIERYHVDFIKQAIVLAEAGSEFHWTCETFWAVERFLEEASAEWVSRFEIAVRRGSIELSGSYLNMTELIDDVILTRMLQKATEYGRSLGVEVKSAMTADINGYSWGFANCLADAGMENLFSCVHTHHGMFPLFRKQTPFWWETEDRKRILVWSGDHYMLGNDLGVAPLSLHSYNIRDELAPPPEPENHWHIAETRISRYLNNLDAEGYAWDFVPVMVSGLITDNAPPNGQIVDFVREWNEKYGTQVEMRISTLQSFFDLLRQHGKDIPVYKGDWPDWWADGVSSTAAHTQVMRQAQRTLRAVRLLDPQSAIAGEVTVAKAEYNVMMYAEHTWGYSSSVYEPWNPLVQALNLRKDAYAAEAGRLSGIALDRVMAAKGEISPELARPLRFKVVNPHPWACMDIVQLPIDYWEYPKLKSGLKVMDESSGNVIAHQVHSVARGKNVCVQVSLQPGEEKTFFIQPAKEQPTTTTNNLVLHGADGVSDLSPMTLIHEKPRLYLTETGLETPYVRISWEVGLGITEWTNVQTGQSLLRNDRDHNPFTPVYEVTPADHANDMTGVRFRMGRNRKGNHAVRTAGRLVKTKRAASGLLFSTVELLYEVPGASHYSMLLTAYADSPRVDVAVRLHKDSVWEPENLYIALPFGFGDANATELWIEKTGSVLRPRRDQLPGTGTDFYCIQEGLAYVQDGRGLSIAMPDTPIIQLGPLEHQPRLLQGHPDLENDKAHLYSWALNNYWETNFKASIGGFYEFRYFVNWGEVCETPKSWIQRCHSMNFSPLSFRIGN